jgi:hypothetical protein
MKNENANKIFNNSKQPTPSKSLKNVAMIHQVRQEWKLSKSYQMRTHVFVEQACIRLMKGVQHHMLL